MAVSRSPSSNARRAAAIKSSPDCRATAAFNHWPIQFHEMLVMPASSPSKTTNGKQPEERRRLRNESRD